MVYHCAQIPMATWLFEIIFWSVFLILNGLNFAINYAFHAHNSTFLPYVGDLKRTGKIGVIASNNLDPFRYVNELSLVLLASRLTDLSAWHGLITATYLLFLLFNQYQYFFRKIYQQEPILQSDVKLLKNGLSIVWHESPLKVVIGVLLFIGLVFLLDSGMALYLQTNASVGPTLFSHVLSGIWILTALYSPISIKKLLKPYPSDLYMRYHFTLAEFLYNLKRSYDNYLLSKQEFGSRYHASRADITLSLPADPPNIFIIFIESYGSFFFQEPALRASSLASFESFSRPLVDTGYHIRSNYSASTTSGGQSWLTFSSMLYGYRIDNNTLFENHLNDPLFRQGNSLLKVLRSAGYTNYHLNPINPIDGIYVPYDEMREFYQIDRWILANDMNYQGDQYGFGACPPDQFSMNFMMEEIKKDQPGPYTYFYLTKNSHSPFMSPKRVDDWRTLNKPTNKKLQEEGFLQRPKVSDYQVAMQYEYDVLQEFILNHPNERDIFLLMGDHQPPFICDPQAYEPHTPVHIISKHPDFVKDFEHYDFKEEVKDIHRPLRHEALYSIFLKIFAKHFASSYQHLPDYEPEGVQL